MEIVAYIQQMFEITARGEKQGIWFFASVYLFALCAFSFWVQFRTRSWPTTQGSLVQSQIDKFGYDSIQSEQTFKLNTKYIYSVKNVDYEGSRISPWVFVASYNAKAVLNHQMAKVKMHPSGGIIVHYNPDNPQKSYLLVAGKIGLFVTSLVGVLPLILYWLEYHA
ncbi:Protein of unknown function [Arsukibacterium tuosuense]|uniref:DUF3592 domain-containing protein n=1 Tax=Arsukibacterium tuosuense TaxID=1323745 RepID=A0A285IN80_9GAMM|nr:DUF3592 domain-containing protein [Arsukibacterium tuosuense]SNY49449.1 Protein of unknown function [Arsukibacterium tuosuense]